MNSLFFVEHRGRNNSGKWFLELDRDSNSRAAIIEQIRTGEIEPVKVIEVCEDEGWVRDCTIEFLVEVRADEIKAHVHAQMAHWDHERDYRKHDEVV